jgi:hypothetical protein
VSAITSAAARVGSRVWGVPAALYAAAVGYLAVNAPRHAVALVGAPVVVLLAMNPWWAAAVAVAALPIQSSVGAGGVQVAATDVLLLTCFAGMIPLIALRPDWRAKLAAVKPTLPWILPFLGWLVVVLLVHLSLHSAINTVQYAELTGFAIVVGAAMLTPKTARWAMIGFLAVACITAVLWTVRSGSFSVDNKNPAGQFMVDALLLSLIVVPKWRWRGPIVLLLILGTLHTESRGAVLGAGIGGLVLLAFRGLGSWKRTTAAILPLALVCVIGYNFVPSSLQARVRSTFSSDKLSPSAGQAGVVPGDLTSNEYSVQIRTIYRHDGIALVKAHPLFGVGVGNYLTGNAVADTQTDDPHDVLLLNAGEGGLPDLGLFLVMLAGTSVLLLRRRRKSPWAGPALAMQAAILTHGLVDIYWVRGTPVMAWLLVGMALNPLLDNKPEPSESFEPKASATSARAAVPVSVPVLA